MCDFNWIELGTLIVAILGFGWTIKTLNNNNKIKRAEFLKDSYKDLSGETISNFFTKLEGAIRDKKESELLFNPMERKDYYNNEEVENEKSLISLLTLFDEIYYFYETELICEKELVYVAYELKLLSEPPCIKNYIQQYHALIDSFPTLVQIRFLKTSYLGQHNEDGTMINPIMPLDTLFLGLLRPYRQSLDPFILDSKMDA